MKALSIVLSVIAALLLALMAVFYIGGSLGTDVEVVVTQAQDAPEAFESAAQAVRTGHAAQRFASLEGEDAEDYALAKISVTFNNGGLFAAEWLTFSVSPGEGDVAVYARSAESLDIPARSSAQLELSLLCAGEDAGAGRALQIEYYVLGMKRTAEISID